jgi:hypothetical protein
MTHGTWPDSATSASNTWDLTSQDSTKYDVDAKLWAALQARSPILSMIPRYKVNNFNFHWETDNEPTRTYVLESVGGSGIEDATQTTNTVAGLTSGSDVEVGSIIRNITRASALGAAYNYADELMEVTANTAGACTVVRAINGDGTTGYGSHTVGDSFEIVWAPKQEGSSAGRNKWTDVTIVQGYTSIVDFYLAVSGSMAATDKAVSADSLQNQFNKCMVQLQSELEHMVLYGDESSTAGGSASYVRRTKGLDGWLVGGYANGVVDYSTRAVTEDALNDVFAGILTNKTDPSDRFIIACHPTAARVISGFGSDKVQVGIELTKWGRYIDTFKTDLGVTAPVIWTLNCSKSDLFVINLNKIALAEFRPFTAATWTYSDDGGDRWQQRYLGELGVKVVNGTYSHGKLGYLTW